MAEKNPNNPGKHRQSLGRAIHGRQQAREDLDSGLVVVNRSPEVQAALDMLTDPNGGK